MSEPQANARDRRYYLLKVAHDQFGCAPEALDATQREQAERIVARQLRIEQAVLHSPEASAVVIPSAQVDQAWQSVASRYADSETLHEALDAHGLDDEGLRAMLARELRVEAVLESVSAGLPEIDESELEQYYTANAERFVRPEMRRARHILITINPQYPENTRQAARARLAAIAEQLRSRPEKFADQAMRHSECPTALQGGLLGDIAAGTLYPELEACLFALAPEALSGVVESPLGFHLLWCEAVMPAGPIPREEALPRLRDTLQERLRRKYQRQWLASLLQRSATLEEPAHG